MDTRNPQASLDSLRMDHARAHMLGSEAWDYIQALGLGYHFLNWSDADFTRVEFDALTEVLFDPRTCPEHHDLWCYLRETQELIYRD